MPEKRLLNTNIHGNTDNHKTVRFSFFSNPSVLGSITFFILMLLFGLLIYQRYELVKEANDKEAYKIIHTAQENLQQALTQCVSAAKTLTFFIDKDGQVNNFDSIASEVLKLEKEIDAVQLVPGGVIKYVYPKKENEKVIGYNVLLDSARNKEAYKAIGKKNMFFAGPFELKQGGVGVVGRLSVYRNDKFWGFSAVVIKMSTLFRTAGIDTSGKNGYYFQLSKINPDSHKEEYFLPEYPGFKNGQEVSVMVPNGEWKLSVTASRTYKGYGDIYLLAILGFLMSVIGGISVFRFASRPKILNELVMNRTLELKASEHKYRSLIEQASDGIVITDMKGYILEVNNSIKTMIGLQPDEIMSGHHLTDYLPEENLKKIPLRFEELRMGKSLLYERKLLKKDGSIVDVEVNSKMASADTLIGFVRDISERKIIETNLRESESKFSKAFNSDMLGFAISDLDFRIVDINDTYADILNISKDSLLGKTSDEAGLMSKVKPENRKAVSDKIDQVLADEGELHNFEVEFEKDKGELATMLISIEKIEYNNKPHWLTLAIDITANKKAELLLKESEARYRTIIEQASDGIFLANADRYYIDVNTAGCRMLGYTKEELLKTKFTDLVLPEDLEKNPIRIGQLKLGDTLINERRLRRKDGSIIDVEISAKILLDGTYQSITRDITARKKEAEILQQSEKKYKLLFYNNPMPMWMTTLPGLDIIDINDAAIKQYGYSREEFLKLNTRNLRPEEDVENFLKEVAKMKPDIINIRNWRHKKKDGTIIQVETYSHEIMYEGQRVWLGSFNDVTEKVEAKDQLQKSHEELRQLASNLQSIREDERTKISREIHDELGQQLTGLKMDLHWMSKKISNTDDEIVKKMSESIELINETINSVRKISTDLRPSILDDLGLLAALEWQGEEFTKRSGTKVKFINKAGEIVVQPEAATGIFRIYQELLTNIARHANASFVRSVLYKDDKKLYFSINDNGNGFDLESISNKKTLGLLGIKERTLLLGGTYEFKSKPGESTITTISIPLSYVKEASV